MSKRRLVAVAAGGVLGALVVVIWPRSHATKAAGARPAELGAAVSSPSRATGRFASFLPRYFDTSESEDEGDVPGVVSDKGSYSPDPASPEYDASRALFDRHHMYGDALWAAEPVREPWASQRARAILDYTKADIAALDPHARVEIECRTATCRVRVFSTNPYLTEDAGPYPFSCMAKLGIVTALGAGEGPDRYSEIYLVFHPRGVADEGFLAYQERYCPKERTKWLTYVQQPFPPP